jgi:hypothetical protein
MLADMDTGGVEVTAATAARTRDRGARTFKPIERVYVEVLYEESPLTTHGR